MLMDIAVTFNTLNFARKLKDAGIPEKQAEAQAEALSEVVEHSLATKQDFKDFENRINFKFKELESDLYMKLKELEYGMVLKMGAMLTVAVSIIVALDKLL